MCDSASGVVALCEDEGPKGEASSTCLASQLDKEDLVGVAPPGVALEYQPS